MIFMEIEYDLSKNLQQNASAYFEEAKRLDDARHWQERLMRDYQLPMEIFSSLAPSTLPTARD